VQVILPRGHHETRLGGIELATTMNFTLAGFNELAHQTREIAVAMSAVCYELRRLIRLQTPR
jgi:hypothetical protein